MNTNSELEPSADRYMVPSVKIAMDVLKLLKQKEHRISSLTEISKALGVSKSSIFMVLKTLQGGNFISYDEPQKKYSLGFELLGLGGAVADDLDVLGLARTFARELAKQTQETCIVVRWVKRRFVVLHCEEPMREVRLTMTIGESFSYISGAVGKAYLAFSVDEHLREISEEVPLRPFTPYSITDNEEFKKELERCRQQGYAEGYEEAVLGINGVAAPVLDKDGNVVLVMGILGFSSSLPPKAMRIAGELVREATLKISVAVGGSRQSDDSERDSDSLSRTLQAGSTVR